MKADFYNHVLTNKSGTTLGSELLRDILIPSLVGNNEDIMYWSGKLLARKLILASKNDLRLFFQYAGWGQLKLIKSKKDLNVYELSGDPVKMRLKVTEKPDFKLEAGFIAETYQLIDNLVTEAKIDKINEKDGIITINVHVDNHAPVIAEKPETEPFSMIEFDKLQREAQQVTAEEIDFKDEKEK